MANAGGLGNTPVFSALFVALGGLDRAYPELRLDSLLTEKGQNGPPARPEIGTDEIAAAAELAVGTLYRHFPTKTDLVVAAVAEYVDNVAERAEAARDRAAAGARPVEQITAFLENVVEASATDRGVKAAANTLGASPANKAGVARATTALTSSSRPPNATSPSTTCTCSSPAPRPTANPPPALAGSPSSYVG
jgi:Bacterial regulatory proteins, tetR family